MNHAYWNNLAVNYTDDVLEIMDHDLSGTFVRVLKQTIKKNHVVADLGCGPGSLLPYLSRRAKKVYAVDFAQELLDLAQTRFALPNVTYQQYDLTASRAPNIKADVVCCVNALIHPEGHVREAMLRNVGRCLKASGVGLLVVPSFESILHVYRTMVDVTVRGGVTPKQAQRLLEKAYAEEVLSSVSGIVNVGGEPTKCYTREELVAWLSARRLKVVDIHKIEFSWEEEIDHAPKYLKNPYPWDWLVVFSAKG